MSQALKEKFGGYQSQARDAWITVAYPGKAPFGVISHRVSTTSDIQQQCQQMLGRFVRHSFPDGTPVPEIKDIKLGRLEWIAT